MARHWLRSIGAAEPSHGHLVEEIPVMQCSRLLFELHALFGAFSEIRVLRHDKTSRPNAVAAFLTGEPADEKKVPFYATAWIKKRTKEIRQKWSTKMPARSKKQQMAAGAALAAKRGERSKASLKGASRQMVNSMSEQQLADFAKTKRKGLPRKKAS